MRRIAAASLLFALACSNAQPTPAMKLEDTILLESRAFGAGMRIPDAYACKPTGRNFSPPLQWQPIPQGTVELALVLEDLSAGRSVHWLVYGIDPHHTTFPLDEVPPGAEEGTNDRGTAGYFGPCPPRDGRIREYRFTIYALRSPLGLEAGARKDDVLGRLDGRATAKGTLHGVYERD